MLRLRLSLLLASALLLALLAFAGLAGAVFAQIQDRELGQLLQRELTRVQTLLDQEAVGERFLDTPGQSMTLQFVTRGGQVAIPSGNPQALPKEAAPTLVDRNGRTLMVASAPWKLASGTTLGTIRLGMDVTDALAARRTLRVSLVTSGLLIAVAAMLAGLLILGRTLRPLKQLAVQADALDPRDPHLTAVTDRRDEVGRVYDALRRALEAIRERQQAERDALAEVAHELAAPLSVVAGQLDALSESDDDPHVRAARDAARELLYTSQDLLSLARGELERPVELEAVDLGGLARRVAHEYPGVEVAAEGKARVLASPLRLSQAVRNLVRNALQAASGPAGVRVRVVRDGSAVRLEVHDDGPGLDEEARRHVFERYYTRRRAAGGSGIGLAVVRAIVEAHDGSVAVRSTPGEGSVFSLVLPSLEAQIEA